MSSAPMGDVPVGSSGAMSVVITNRHPMWPATNVRSKWSIPWQVSTPSQLISCNTSFNAFLSLLYVRSVTSIFICPLLPLLLSNLILPPPAHLPPPTSDEHHQDRIRWYVRHDPRLHDQVRPRHRAEYPRVPEQPSRKLYRPHQRLCLRFRGTAAHAVIVYTYVFQYGMAWHACPAYVIRFSIARLLVATQPDVRP